MEICQHGTHTMTVDEAGNRQTENFGAAPLLIHHFSQGIATDTSWSLTDTSGWVRALMDDQGNLVQHYTYDNEFGLVTGHVGASSQSTPLSQLPVAWPYLYKGLRLLGADVLNGKTLYHAGARVFDAETASYLQRNPYNPTTSKGDTPTSDLSSVEGTLSPFNGPSGSPPEVPQPGPRHGGPDGMPPITIRVPRDPITGPPDPPKPNGPGGGSHRGPHKYALPTQPGGGTPGGSGGDGGSPKRFDDPRPKYDDGSGGSDETRSTGGGYYTYPIPLTKKEIAAALEEFRSKHAGVYDVVWKIIDGDLYMWGRHTDGTVIVDGIPPEIQKLLEGLLPPDSRMLAQFDQLVGLLDTIIDSAGLLGLGGDLAGAAGHFATSLLTAYIHNGTITADDVIAAAKDVVIQAATAAVLAGALAKAIDKFTDIIKAAKRGKGLGGNPFKGKSPDRIDKMLRDKGYVPKGPDPLNGKGTYLNTRTGRSVHIDANHPPPKGPHVSVQRPRGSRDLPPREYRLK